MTIEKIALVQAWEEAGHLFSEQERAALAWAETVTLAAETNVPDKAYEPRAQSSRKGSSLTSPSRSA